MSKNAIIIGIIILIAALGLFFWRGKDAASPEEAITDPGLNGEIAAETQNNHAGIVIRITENGFEPKEITVPAGTAVAFSNETGENRWPASGPHPTHQIYPEFDPKRPIAAGESWIFTFNKIGEWGYHDHLFSNMTGTITVE